MSHKPASALKTLPLIWPFAVWGLDMVGPLRTGRSGFTHVFVAVDKFTKWIEAKPIKNLEATTVVSFIRELTFRYGVPHSIITNNGSNFDSDEFRAFCASQGTRVDYASVAHPTHVFVAVDKFTKWIEAKPIKNLEATTVVSFIRELTFRYGVPHSIITNNGSNFDSDEFRAFCASQGTRVDYASVAHPQSNGQAERANGLILKGLKPRLMRYVKHAAGAWVDELPSVLWGLRTTPNRSTGRTPFFLVYGAEAVLPSDLLHNAPRVERRLG